ncbi:hypothetical protein EUGRSUZ_G03343 [Eucalyptus grandis]|uniref:Uncharacterized protein n=2 Tax=Eucalyptus grandis TaxID=71139 RepID=A0ACC3KAB4_EUCGR|nr:hypothetical protein EUGRSUZ_G03343 [Eucalyptus grandis]
MKHIKGYVLNKETTQSFQKEGKQKEYYFQRCHGRFSARFTTRTRQTWSEWCGISLCPWPMDSSLQFSLVFPYVFLVEKKFFLCKSLVSEYLIWF